MQCFSGQLPSSIKCNLFSKRAMQSIVMSACLLLSVQIAHAVSIEEKTQGQNAQDTSSDTQFFLVQNAQKAHLEPGSEKGTHYLTLYDISPRVIYFSDRPLRKAGHISLQKYLDLWIKNKQGSFRNTPPNAAIQSTIDGATTQFVVLLDSPEYNPEKKTLRYTIKPLENNTVPAGKKTLEHVALLIDDVCLSCF